jgi:hypothetical protein
MRALSATAGPTGLPGAAGYCSGERARASPVALGSTWFTGGNAACMRGSGRERGTGAPDSSKTLDARTRLSRVEGRRDACNME